MALGTALLGSLLSGQQQRTPGPGPDAAATSRQPGTRLRAGRAAGRVGATAPLAPGLRRRPRADPRRVGRRPVVPVLGRTDRAAGPGGPRQRAAGRGPRPARP